MTAGTGTNISLDEMQVFASSLVNSLTVNDSANASDWTVK
ncbi:hypothetical protein QFZ77_006049 [Paenibacillus sp. V4I3]|nr:hypothetical protein [Paenibacillus sp. V4I3]MDQ0886745.1 hypothetical protein [Paenibacillus sp. V4I9]